MKTLMDAWRAWRQSRDVEPGAGPAQGDVVAEESPYLEAWRNGTEQARRRSADVRVDIAYGNREKERFDLYLPVHRPHNLPFAAFVHGSDWRQSMRPAAGYPARAIHRHGAAFIAIGFDAVPDRDLTAQVDQVRRAWRHLRANAAHLGLDPARGHLLGHASGAHLAALAGFDPQGPPPASVVLLSGIYDLEAIRRSASYPHLALDPETATRLSPIRWIQAGGPAVTVLWGGNEPAAARRQSEDFARACKRRGLRVSQGELPGRDQMETSLELANPHSEALATIRRRG